MPETYTCHHCEQETPTLIGGECDSCIELANTIVREQEVSFTEAVIIRDTPTEPTPNGKHHEREQPPDEFTGNFDAYFRLLGYTGKHYAFHVKRTGQVFLFSGPDLNREGNLYMLAPKGFWDDNFGNTKFAMNSIMRHSESIGYYDPAIIRGRGAWEDKGRSVLHLGNKLIVDGKAVEISDFDTQYIYEHRVSMRVNPLSPLQNEESSKLIDICALMRWDDPLYGQLLAGWIFSAIVCGALQWRSHMYIYGQKGTGKTWIVDNVVRRCLGGIALGLQSKTTEAGIRQAIAGDARPVIFDESEAEAVADRQRMQRVYDLARQASSESAPPIIKGTAGGMGAIEYVVRSCFLFSSINSSVQQQADESRITMLKLAAPFQTPDHSFPDLEKAVFGTLTDKYRDGLIAR